MLMDRERKKRWKKMIMEVFRPGRSLRGLLETPEVHT
jgi:hypothetical protein